MKIKITRTIFLIATILTCIIIFVFSNQNGEKSSSTSRGFVKTIIEVLPITKNLNQIEKQQIIENSQIIIRKTAHFSIYTILGINLLGFIDTYDKFNQKNKIIIVLLIGIIYATSDEIHQMFSGGRTPAILDVLIDSLGIGFGILILLKTQKILGKISKRKYS